MTIDEHVAAVVAQAPPLTEEQRTRLIRILHPKIASQGRQATYLQLRPKGAPEVRAVA